MGKDRKEVLDPGELHGISSEYNTNITVKNLDYTSQMGLPDLVYLPVPSNYTSHISFRHTFSMYYKAHHMTSISCDTNGCLCSSMI